MLLCIAVCRYFNRFVTDIFLGLLGRMHNNLFFYRNTNPSYLKWYIIAAFTIPVAFVIILFAADFNNCNSNLTNSLVKNIFASSKIFLIFCKKLEIIINFFCRFGVKSALIFLANIIIVPRNPNIFSNYL